MGCRRLFPSLLYLFLFATTVQGITPDANNLVSVRCFKLLVPLLDDPNTLADDEKSPGEACGTVQCTVNSNVCRAKYDLPDRRMARFVARLQLLKSHDAVLSCHSCDLSSHDDVLNRLCRLTC